MNFEISILDILSGLLMEIPRFSSDFKVSFGISSLSREAPLDSNSSLYISFLSVVLADTEVMNVNISAK